MVARRGQSDHSLLQHGLAFNLSAARLCKSLFCKDLRMPRQKKIANLSGAGGDFDTLAAIHLHAFG